MRHFRKDNWEKLKLQENKIFYHVQEIIARILFESSTQEESFCFYENIASNILLEDSSSYKDIVVFVEKSNVKPVNLRVTSMRIKEVLERY